jgi:hypothetical protein
MQETDYSNVKPTISKTVFFGVSHDQLSFDIHEEASVVEPDNGKTTRSPDIHSASSPAANRHSI